MWSACALSPGGGPDSAFVLEDAMRAHPRAKTLLLADRAARMVAVAGVTSPAPQDPRPRRSSRARRAPPRRMGWGLGHGLARAWQGLASTEIERVGRKAAFLSVGGRAHALRHGEQKCRIRVTCVCVWWTKRLKLRRARIKLLPVAIAFHGDRIDVCSHM